MTREESLRYAFQTVEKYMRSDEWRRLSTAGPKDKTKAFSTTKLDNMIFDSLMEKNTEMSKVASTDTEASIFDSFRDIVQDIFQALFGGQPRRNAEASMTTAARKYNLSLLDKLYADERFPVLRKLCRGRELVAFEALLPFTEQMPSWIDRLANAASSRVSDDAMKTLQHLEERQEKEIARLCELLMQSEEGQDRTQKPQPSSLTPKEQREALHLAKQTAKREKQIAYLSDAVDSQLRRQSESMQESMKTAIADAIERAEQAAYAIASWGSSAGTEESHQANKDLINRVKQSDALRRIIKYLGRFRDLFENMRKDGFAYGRGDKYDITLGNDFSRAVSSEYAYLALSETIPLFIEKVQRKSLKQYRKRERITKGYGDIIICLDESGSMIGEPIAWAKAMALVLAEAAHRNRRSCAVIRFASATQVEAHVFRTGQYSVEDVFAMCESFFDGGTEYTAPLDRAMTLIEEEGFTNADVVMLTDGECCVPEAFVERFGEKKKALRFTVTGILIDEGAPGMMLGLVPFCDAVYRTSEMTKEQIVRNLIAKAA